MKNKSLIKSGIGLLLAAGALAPVFAAVEANTEWSYREGALYDNLRNASTAPGADMFGAQGPIRTESRIPDKRGDGYNYDRLRDQATANVPSGAMYGAQGAIRTDSTEANWSYREGALYDNLRNQSSQ
jgi:hypothetical protein